MLGIFCTSFSFSQEESREALTRRLKVASEELNPMYCHKALTYIKMLRLKPKTQEEAEAILLDFELNASNNPCEDLRQELPNFSLKELKEANGLIEELKEMMGVTDETDYGKIAREYLPTKVEWYEEEFMYGTVSQGGIVRHAFRFKNIGTEPLHIVYVKGSCGCTAWEWPKEPILPGDEGEIGMQFDSDKKFGKSHHCIMVYNNDDAELPFKRLCMKGEVVIEFDDVVPATEN